MTKRQMSARVPVALLLAAGALHADIGPSGLDSRPGNTTCLAPPRPTGGSGITTSEPFSPSPGFTLPVKVLQAPGDPSRWFVLEQGGRVQVFSASAPGAVSTYLDLTGRINADCSSNPSSCGESGLLGLAFHPGFPATPEVFASYTAGPSGSAVLVSRVSRITVTSTVTGGIGSEQTIISIDQPNTSHNGGDIAFGPDGYLYYGLGDGGGGEEVHAQDTTDLLGSMLRIGVVGTGAGYTIPADNPFAANPKCNGNTGPGANAQSCPEIYAWGFRNPWRWSFDRPTGQLWVGDVGQSGWEEVDVVQNGGNYGWPCREGAHDYNPVNCPSSGLIDPVTEYDHTKGVAITGGFVYRGSAIPSLQGRYVFTDYSAGPIRALRNDGSGDWDELLVDGSAISAFGVGADGELYYADYSYGHIGKVVPSSGGTPDTIPSNLSDTGCVNVANPTQPASGLIPYSVNDPLWSDGTTKQRWLALPNGSTITLNNTTNDWALPPGSVIMKLFQLNGNPIETRLLMRHPDGVWAGYTYEWNASGTQAIRLQGGKTKLIGSGQQWIYPSESQCTQCHTATAGFSLGLETGQLNGNFTYPVTGRTANQLATLDHIGMFSSALVGVPANYTKLPDPADSNTPLYFRARSYLHANCSQCHRPGGPTPSTMDLRFTTPMAGTNACSIAPQSGNLGISNAKLIQPGSAASSIIVARMGRRDSLGMPPLASTLVDNAGVATVSAWINSLQSCTDADNDGADDAVDNCLGVGNPTQLDVDGDGYGNTCDADLNNSGLVTSADYTVLRSVLNLSASSSPTAALADLNGSGTVTTVDLTILRNALNKPPGPSALHP